MFSRIGVAKTLAWMETLQTQGVGIFVMGVDHFPRLNALMRQYSHLPMDLADGSLVLLAEDTGEGRIVSTDESDFHTYRWKNQRSFRNLCKPFGGSSKQDQRWFRPSAGRTLGDDNREIFGVYGLAHEVLCPVEKLSCIFHVDHRTGNLHNGK